MVDDDELFTLSVRDGLDLPGVEVVTAGSGEEARRLLAERSFDAVLLDQHLPDMGGWLLCPEILSANERAKIIFITAFPHFDNARQAIRAGAFDYLSKPCDLEELRLTISRCLRHLELEKSVAARELQTQLAASDSSFAGASKAYETVRELAKVAAESEAPVLLTGETGTGKSLLARRIHALGRRRGGEIVELNCAALPESLVESELFGYEKGAFTGASTAREGLIEMAHGGTLFLDEIGDMPIALQSRLLSVLEDQSVRRIGGRTMRRADFRLISATNSDLLEGVATKRFRRDLYFRLDVIRIEIPPLRERREDITALTDHFLARLGRGAPLSVPPEERRALARYDWPGNARELRNVLERAILLRTSDTLCPSRFLGSFSSAPHPDPEESATPVAPEDLPSLASVEGAHISRVLAACGGNVTRAARILGVSISTLRRHRSE